MVARSPPGLSRNVLVYAVPASGSQLKVTWQQGETYGAPIGYYTILLRDTGSLVWTVAATVSGAALAASGNTTFLQYLAVPNAYSSYEVGAQPSHASPLSPPLRATTTSPYLLVVTLR